ncbi:hypothetical protein HJFPF1_03420 [Paramyrothecium foliicola]|nr:hypothetical protein HJFPF1_03420 [Paramyrothecium foliicola]
MTPPCQSFAASDLPRMIQLDARGRRRKLADDAGPRSSSNNRVDLGSCELLRMLQYKCEVERPLTKASAVRCFPVDRLFRRCQDKKGSFMVETTAWEGTQQPPNSGNSGNSGHEESTKPAGRTYQWSTHWSEADPTP